MQNTLLINNDLEQSSYRNRKNTVIARQTTRGIRTKQGCQTSQDRKKDSGQVHQTRLIVAYFAAISFYMFCSNKAYKRIISLIAFHLSDTSVLEVCIRMLFHRLMMAGYGMCDFDNFMKE